MPIQDVTVSTFASKGKLSALKIICTNNEIQNTFAQMGKEWDVIDKLIDKLEKFTCLLYGAKSGATKVNDLRYHRR